MGMSRSKERRLRKEDCRNIPSHGRVSADLAGLEPMTHRGNLARKRREQAWADRTLTTGNFKAETRSKLTQAYDMTRKVERDATDAAVRSGGANRPQAVKARPEARYTGKGTSLAAGTSQAPATVTRRAPGAKRATKIGDLAGRQLKG